jgi:hypothetical protein
MHRNGDKTMKTLNERYGRLTIAGLALLGAMWAPRAQAACGDASHMPYPFQFQLPDAGMYEAARKDAGIAASRENGAPAPSIVGMWKFQVASTSNATHNPPIPDGATVDVGYSQWHSDGLEFSTSSPHSPASGNICLGTWAQTRDGVYHLNHFGLNYDASGNFNATVQIHQTVTLSAGGNIYTGTYIIDVYDLKGNRLDHVNGIVTATRLTVDSPL